MSNLLYGGIEGGGTKFICAIGDQAGNLLSELRFPTTTPEETLGQSISFFQEQAHALGKLAGIGVACFGPLDPNPGSPTYGKILPTPKPGWAGVDIVGALENGLHLPIAFDTDVNGAALGEWRWGAAQGLDTFVYLTIGTGIGGGGLVNGKLIHGLLHPEMGHVPLPHNLDIDPFKGICPFHGDCFEGLACGPAIEQRWGQKAETLAPDHRAWQLEADYIAQALCIYICTLSPQRIIIGGGVIQQPQLLPLIHQKTLNYLNNYVQSESILKRIDKYIVLPKLGSRAGVLGAIALAQMVLMG